MGPLGHWVVGAWRGAVLMLLMVVPSATAAITNYFNFETAPVHPVALGPDGRTLAVCNLPDARVELFDVSGGVPVPIGSVPVGLDPVTARFAAANEVWVVNHISSTISIVDVAALSVVATLETLAGPSDLVFAGSPRRAWVSCSRTNAVMVIDTVTRATVTNIAIAGERPRAMATSPDGTKVYVAIFESGNGTTVIGRKLTGLVEAPPAGPVDDPNGPYRGTNPPPNSGTAFNPAINPSVTFTPPRVSHLVRKNAAGRWLDDNNGDWTEWVSGSKATNSGRFPGWDLPDRDLAIIDTASLQVSYAHRLMNICMGIAVNPVSGQIAIVGTEALNERRFEPVIKGVFLRVNIALVDPLTRTSQIRDLNSHLDYTTRTLPHTQRALALGDPRGIVWNSDGTRAYVTGMGSRNLIIVDATGNRVNPQPIELGEGPTGMALDESRSRLYIWNHFSSSISVVDTSSRLLVTNVPVFDPTPEIVRKGRRHLYDTRKTSGLGIVACGSCHVDARHDRLAWDLGDPASPMLTNETVGVFHPMKGPKVTQTLQDIITPTNFNGRTLRHQPLHWRGDRPNIEAFNVTFTALQANDVELTTDEMAEFKEMLSSIFFPPNFLRTFSNSLPTSVPLPGHLGLVPIGGGPRSPLPPGNPRITVTRFFGGCGSCHSFNQGRGGTNDFVNLARNPTEGIFKSAQLRSLAEKVGMDGASANGRAGFGFMHDGRVDTLTRFMEHGFPGFAPNDQALADVIALLLCFSGSDFGFPPALPSQDVPAATGKQLTFASATPPPLLNAMSNLSFQANSRLDLVLRGKKNGRMRSWLFRHFTQDFQSDRNGEIAASLSDVIASAAPGNEFTAMLVPRGAGLRLALDRDGDGHFDTSEIEQGYDPANPASFPGPKISITRSASELRISWQSETGETYVVQWRTNLAPSDLWKALSPPFGSGSPMTIYTDAPPAGDLQRFYRVRLLP